MKRKHKTQILLVIAISFLLPLLSACIDYYVLTEADFFNVLQFENPDLDCLLLCKEQKFTASSGSPHAFWIASNLAKHFSYLYYQVTFPQVKTLVLRC